MTDPNYVEPNQDWRARARAAQVAKQQAAPIAPQNKEGGPKKSGDFDDSVKDSLKSIPMLEWYRSNLAPNDHERQLAGDEINVACFNPLAHPRGDRNPQFNINQRMNVYVCHGCGIKGDMLDLLANKYGLADENFTCPDGAIQTVVETAGADILGATAYIDSMGRRQVALPNAPQVADTDDYDRISGYPVFNMGSGAAPFAAPVTGGGETEAEMPPATDADMQILGNAPTMDWESVLSPHGFAYSYMNYARQNDSIEEFHLYNAFLALGLAAGRDIRLRDAPFVLANAFVCDIGPSGSGKTKAASILKNVVRTAFPYHPESGVGVRVPPEAASGEILVEVFRPTFQPPPDPNNAKMKIVPIVFNGIKGLVDYSELSSLMNRIARQGTTLDNTLMALYDGADRVGTMSRGSGEVEAVDPFCSMLTTSQPKRIADLIKQEQVNSGFANRIIYAFGKVKPEIAINEEMPSNQHLVDKLIATSKWCTVVRNTCNGIIEWEPAARARYEEFHHTVMVPMKQKYADDDMMTRLTLAMKKHVLWLCIDEQQNRVTVDILEKAFAFWDYLVACNRIIAGNVDTNKVGEQEEKILEGIKHMHSKNGTWPTKSQLRKDYLGSKKWSLHDLDMFIKGLVQHGHIIELPPAPGPGQARPRLSVPDDE